MGVFRMLEYGSNIVQVLLGLIAFWSARRLWHIPKYRWPLLTLAVAVTLTGLAGLRFIGELDTINAYRRPLFIIERTATALIIAQIVIRNLHLARQQSSPQ
jgi:hypothetical protein